MQVKLHIAQVWDCIRRRCKICLLRSRLFAQKQKQVCCLGRCIFFFLSFLRFWVCFDLSAGADLRKAQVQVPVLFYYFPPVVTCWLQWSEFAFYCFAYCDRRGMFCTIVLVDERCRCSLGVVCVFFFFFACDTMWLTMFLFILFFINSIIIYFIAIYF